MFRLTVLYSAFILLSIISPLLIAESRSVERADKPVLTPTIKQPNTGRIRPETSTSVTDLAGNHSAAYTSISGGRSFPNLWVSPITP